MVESESGVEEWVWAEGAQEEKVRSLGRFPIRPSSILDARAKGSGHTHVPTRAQLSDATAILPEIAMSRVLID